MAVGVAVKLAVWLALSALLLSNDDMWRPLRHFAYGEAIERVLGRERRAGVVLASGNYGEHCMRRPVQHFDQGERVSLLPCGVVPYWACCRGRAVKQQGGGLLVARWSYGKKRSSKRVDRNGVGVLPSAHWCCAIP